MSKNLFCEQMIQFFFTKCIDLPGIWLISSACFVLFLLGYTSFNTKKLLSQLFKLLVCMLFRILTKSTFNGFSLFSRQN